MLRIALLGAESSGKTHLSHALSRLAEQAGLRVTVMAEPLRAWCDTHGRTPCADEQWQLAQQHAADLKVALNDARLAHPRVDLFIADTSPLQTAAYRAYYFQANDLDDSVLRNHQECFDLSLLMGLDLTWQADPGQRTGPQSQAPVDAQLRRLLTCLVDHPFAVVYGQGHARLACAWQSIRSRLSLREVEPNSVRTAPSRPSERWRATCECCADPESERRIFDLLRNR